MTGLFPPPMFEVTLLARHVWTGAAASAEEAEALARDQLADVEVEWVSDGVAQFGPQEDDGRDR